MGGRSGQSTRGSSGGGADLGSGVDSTDNYKDVTININGTNDTNISTQNLLKLAGIPEDLKGSAEFNFWGGKEVRVFIDSNGIVMNRIINVKENWIKNDLFTINNNSIYKGKGAEIFGNQVKEAQKAGFSKIKVNAAGNKNSSMFNGYYTWARLGYKPDYPTYHLDRIKDVTGRDYGTWGNMMKTSIGRADWKEHGRAWNGSFDLKNNSYSDKTLKAYLEDKKKKKQN